MFGLLGSCTTAPNDVVGKKSVRVFHVPPPLSVRQMPPSNAANIVWSDEPVGETAIPNGAPALGPGFCPLSVTDASTFVPAGPIDRHCCPLLPYAADGLAPAPASVFSERNCLIEAR